MEKENESERKKKWKIKKTHGKIKSSRRVNDERPG
jgi:hypothetical protein